ncbi:MAG: hypothetical protein J5525_12440 [Lachnospiraceae bacterium]|nr:hypothetical protein [Lachnospiraceae bacterium]
MKRVIIASICAFTLIIGCTAMAYAATGFNSKGAISFAGPDETPATSDDIIFDSADLDVIYDEVSTGKQLLVDEVVTQGGEITKAGDEYTFEEIKDGIQSAIDSAKDDGHDEGYDEGYATGYTDGSATTGITITKHYHTTQCYANGYMYTVSCMNCGNGYYSNSESEAASHTCGYCHEYQSNGFTLTTHAIVCGKSQGEVVKITQGTTVLYQK